LADAAGVSHVKSAAGGGLFEGWRCDLRVVGVSPRSQQRTEFELRLTESGSTTLLLGGRETILPARRLAAFWTGTPHQVLAHEAGAAWVLRLPLAWVLRRELPAVLRDGLLEGRVFFEPDIDQFDCDLFRLRLWADEEVKRQPLLRRAVELEIEARLIRLAAALPARLPSLDRPRSTAGGRPRKALEVAALIARRHTDRMSATDLGRAAGRHPNYVMNLFRRELGTSVLEYVTQHRLAHALRLLVTADLSLDEIARQSGFGSSKRLRMTFGAAFKKSPFAFRRRLKPAMDGLS